LDQQQLPLGLCNNILLCNAFAGQAMPLVTGRWVVMNLEPLQLRNIMMLGQSRISFGPSEDLLTLKHVWPKKQTSFLLWLLFPGIFQGFSLDSWCFFWWYQVLCSTPGERIVVSVTSFVTSGRVEKSAWQP